MTFDATQFRAQFPALHNQIVYLDSAATALKPSAMIEETTLYYQQNTATTLRSKHNQAQIVTEKCELARKFVAKMINAPSEQTVIWTRGATESVNLIAQRYARTLLSADDEIIVSELEHHSNFIPWLQVAQQIGAKIIKWQAERDQTLSVNTLASLITPKTRIIAVTQMSNVTGYQPDIAAISQLAHQHNAIIVVDAAQGVVHKPLNVQQYDIDFYLFSAHKLYGPTGLGVLYGKLALLNQMPSWHGGGKMLKQVSFEGFEPADLPYKFEAGTLNIAGIVGFYGTLRWWQTVDWQRADQYTCQLANYAKTQLAQIPHVQIYSAENSTIISFSINDIHHDDLAILLAEQNIALRTGELCAQPFMQALNCAGVIRISLMPYNCQNDIDCFVDALKNALTLF